MSSPSVPFAPGEARRLVEYATAAPSVLNTQPWRFGIDKDGIALYADEGRRLPVLDPDGRQLLMSCGAALLHLRLGIAVGGREPLFSVLPEGAEAPEPGQDRLVAVVAQGRAQVASEEERELWAAVPLRRTNRRPFSPEPPPGAALMRLRAAAATEGATLDLLAGRDAIELAAAVREADLKQRTNPAVRAEIARWTGPRAGAADGVPVESMGPVPAQAGALVRDFGAGDRLVGRERSDFEHSPALAVLRTPGDTPGDWVAAGQALTRVQLSATAAGLAMSYLGQPVEVSALRGTLPAGRPEAGVAQMVLRIGYGPPAPPTPRRPVEDVVAEGAAPAWRVAPRRAADQRSPIRTPHAPRA